ncbi:MAG: hypothetical protein ACK5NK_09615 [Niabella sp.]
MKVIPKKLFIKDVEKLPAAYKTKVLAIVQEMSKTQTIEGIPNIEKLNGDKTFNDYPQSGILTILIVIRHGAQVLMRFLKENEENNFTGGKPACRQTGLQK